tara:strand:+ start:743 stop:1042 length:300 start_codon:yes stop_codon:yes gene_type:complete
MSKDNVIQFPIKKGGGRPSKKIILENRLAELQVENDYMQGDLDYISDQLEINLAETHEVLRQLESLIRDDLATSMSEIKKMTGIDLTPLVPEQDNPEED